MKKSNVYTKTGDTGITGLVGGTRIKKSDSRIHLYGEVDELNSHIGLATSLLPLQFDKSLLQLIQSALFDLGSNLACEKEKRSQFNLPQIKDATINQIESDIDKMDHELAPLKNFILPGGHPSAAAFHVCRTVCRRLERQMVHFEEQNNGEIPEKSLMFVNRLSDYFFIMSRYINHLEKRQETIWTATH